MPYIKKDLRKKTLDNIINLLLTELSFGGGDEKSRAGDITYIIYRILGFAYFARPGTRFADQALGLGILDSVRESLEDDFKRPYEKEKKAECGWKPEDIINLGE